MEMKYVGKNSIILTNSHALLQIIRPEIFFKKFEKSKFVFPDEEDFKFFSSDKILNSSVYEEGKKYFDENLYGFYGSDDSFFSSTSCLSNTSELESYLKDFSKQDPIFIAIINKKSVFPSETKKILNTPTSQQFNYLDLSDSTNSLFTKMLICDFFEFIKRSVLVSTFFGDIELRKVDSYLDPLTNYTPLIVGIKNRTENSYIANFDLFLQFNSLSYGFYFSPKVFKKNEWIHVDYFKKFYPKLSETLSNDAVQVFPNIKPFPVSGGGFFSQPYFIKTLNFGENNFLDICKQKEGSNDITGDIRGAECLLAFLRYSASSGKSKLFK